MRLEHLSLDERWESRAFVELERAATLTSFGVCVAKREGEEVGLSALIPSAE